MEVGAVSFQVRLDLSSIDREIRQLQQRLDGRDLRVQLRPDGAEALSSAEQALRRVQSESNRTAQAAGQIGGRYRESGRAVDQVRTALSRADNEARNLNRTAGRLNSIFAGVAAGITSQFAGALSGALGSGIRAAASVPTGAIAGFATFESGLVDFNARASASTEQLAALRKEAERIGVATSQTPATVAQLATTLVSLGASADDATKQVQGVVNAIEATGFEANDTAKIIQQSATIFGEASDEFADKLAVLASTTAVTSATDIEQALSSAGGAFAGLGQSVDTLLTLQGTFKDLGFTSQTAGTATRNALQKLTGATSESKKALDELGVSLFDAVGNPRQLIAIEEGTGKILGPLAELRDSLKQFSAEQRSDFLLQIFGQESASQIAGLLEVLDDQVATTFTNLNNSLDKAAQQTEARNQGIAASFERLQGSLETFAGQAGGAVAQGLESAIRAGQDVVNVALETEGVFGNLEAASAGFAATLKTSPEIAQTLGRALADVSTIISDGLANSLNRFSNALQENPRLINEIADSLTAAAAAGVRLADVVTIIAGVLGGRALGTFRDVQAAAEGLQRILDGIASRSVVQISIGLGQFLKNAGKLNPVLRLAFLPLRAANNIFQQIIDRVNGLLNRLGLASIGVQEFQEGAGSAAASAASAAAAALDGLKGVAASAASEAGSAALGATQSANQAIVSDAKKTTAELEAENKKRVNDFERSVSQGIASIQQSAQSRVNAVLRQQASGEIDDGEATRQIAAINDKLANDTIFAKQREIAKVQELEQQKVLTAAEAADRIQRLQGDIGQAVGNRLQAEISEQQRVAAEAEKAAEATAKAAEEAQKQQEEIKKATLERIAAELAANQAAAEARGLELDLVQGALTAEQSLIQASTSLAATRNQLDQERLRTALQVAQAEGDVAGAARLTGQIAEAQVTAAEAEFRAKREALGVTERLTRLESQRAIQAAEVAAIESSIAVQRAQATGATNQEVQGLRAIADLRLQQVDAARNAAAIADQVLAKQREELGLQQQISAEQLRQNSIAEAGNRLADARRGIISALAAESNTSTEESLASIKQIADRLRTAQRAGLFQGEDVRGATRDVSRALRSGNDRRLIELAQQDNPLVNQLLQAAGRSDITGLVEADRELNLAKAIETSNDGVEQRLDTLIEQFAALDLATRGRIEQLVVQTPDPVADTSRIVSDVAQLQTQGVNA